MHITVYKSDKPNFLRLEAESSIFGHLSDQLTARDKNCYYNPRGFTCGSYKNR